MFGKVFVVFSDMGHCTTFLTSSSLISFSTIFVAFLRCPKRVNHKLVSQNTNQFRKTQINGLGSCSVIIRGLIPRIFCFQYGDFYNAAAFAKMFCHNCGSEVLKEYLYCSQCGTKLGIAVPSFRLLLSSENVTEREAIDAYFNSGFSYNAILCFLEKYHDVSMSLSTLKRRLSQYNLKRNKTDVDLTDVERLIQNELDGLGSISGYRGMWHTLRVKYGLCIQREEVESLLRRLDPAGVAEQKRHKLKRRKYTSPGPNYCWHVDGNDKRKPLGFPIHGAVDGYSRRVLWLYVDTTNNDPKVMATYFVACVEEVRGGPSLVRTDCGTENVVIADV